MSALKSINYIPLDAPPSVVITVLQRGYLVHKDLELLMAGQEAVLQWRPEVLDLLLFCACGPKGLELRLEEPMRDMAHRLYLHAVSRAAGLDMDDITGYTFCCQAATLVEQGAGDVFTRAMMGHKQFTGTLHESYSNIISQTRDV
ncbi:hypothetical protein C8T65DRAFT_738222 [Cerioporus squamosus]|nr:hypothetical protein C8T65DRAFT_738222 [Cerioporus squamosus]